MVAHEAVSISALLREYVGETCIAWRSGRRVRGILVVDAEGYAIEAWDGETVVRFRDDEVETAMGTVVSAASSYLQVFLG